MEEVAKLQKLQRIFLNWWPDQDISVFSNLLPKHCKIFLRTCGLDSIGVLIAANLVWVDVEDNLTDLACFRVCANLRQVNIDYCPKRDRDNPPLHGLAELPSHTVVMVQWTYHSKPPNSIFQRLSRQKYHAYLAQLVEWQHTVRTRLLLSPGKPKVLVFGWNARFYENTWKLVFQHTQNKDVQFDSIETSIKNRLKEVVA
jgi:hypothetical protein